MACLDENALLDYMGGLLSEEATREVDLHVDGCAACRALISEFVKAEPMTALTSQLEWVKEAGSRDTMPLSAGTGVGRYLILGPLGVGGMGEVVEAQDKELKRTLALKRIRPNRLSRWTVNRFIQEAQITAQLEHPNIVPIHDLGRLPSGEPYFTMKRVTGRSLKEILTLIGSGDAFAASRFHSTRMGIIFLQVVQAVAYAHSRGIIHGDLKPANVLVGEHGEVLVTDWGLATLKGRPRPQAGASAIELSKVFEGGDTRTGLQGTPSYMAPEQLEGEPVGERTDIYSLGAILYEMLTLAPPHDNAVKVKEERRPLVAPRQRAPTREISQGLEEIALKALQPNPAERYESADLLCEAMEEYLTGARKREAAKAQFEEAERARRRWEELSSLKKGLEAERDLLWEQVKPYDGETKKAPLWELEERLHIAELELEEALAVTLDGYSRAVGFDSDFLPAVHELADLHLGLFLEAEAVGDHRLAFFHERQVERYHRGRHAAILSGRGKLTLAPKTSGISMEGHRLVERGKKIVRGEPLVLPAGPAEELELPMGSYLFELRKPGCRTAQLHVFLGRGKSVRVCPELFPEERVGSKFVHVPAGPFVYGGDAGALNSGPRQELWLPDFFMAKHAVTCEEYLEFVNALAAEDPALARRHLPRTKPDGGFLWDQGTGGVYTLPEFDADGNPCHPRSPVMGVSFDDAARYAAWKSTRDGRSYRLPTEQEWEKAARGADGRIFPWGNGFDPTFCKMALSRPGRPQPEPVGSFPADTSVYGMQDASGCIREWCDSFYDPTRETRVLRGGAWYFNPAYCRLAFRHGYLPHIVFTNFGFRLCQSAGTERA